MIKYSEIPVDKAYRLINHGPVVLVSTCAADGIYNIAPVAWNCPVAKSPTGILIAIASCHKTYKNITQSKNFAICVPGKELAVLVSDTGSVSGNDTDKFKKFNISSVKGSKINCLIPEGCIGYLECSLSKEFNTEDVKLVIGECIYAAADARAFAGMLLPENPEGKSLHHLGGDKFATLSGKIISV